MQKKPIEKLNHIAQSIYDKKGFNILALDVRKFSTMTEYYVIAEGNVDRHVRALSSYIIEKMREIGEKPLHLEGEQVGDWVVIDYGEIIIHLFIPEMREKYALEELWKESKIVDVTIKVKDE